MYFKQIELIRDQEEKKQWKFHSVEIQQQKDQKIKEFRKYWGDWKKNDKANLWDTEVFREKFISLNIYIWKEWFQVNNLISFILRNWDQNKEKEENIFKVRQK